MKPEEKAKELRDKFITSTKVFYNDDWKTDLAAAKYCALIVVREIISVIKPIMLTGEKLAYWKDVEAEISKL